MVPATRRTKRGERGAEMKTATVGVDDCRRCPKRHYSGGQILSCGASRIEDSSWGSRRYRRIDIFSDLPIPAWCPLPDAEEEEE